MSQVSLEKLDDDVIFAEAARRVEAQFAAQGGDVQAITLFGGGGGTGGAKPLGGGFFEILKNLPAIFKMLQDFGPQLLQIIEMFKAIFGSKPAQTA